MNAVVPMSIVVTLGCWSGLLLWRWTSNKWLCAFGGGGITTVVWSGGVYLLFWTVAPNELGTPLSAPIFLTFLIALSSAWPAVWINERRADEH